MHLIELLTIHAILFMRFAILKKCYQNKNTMNELQCPSLSFFSLTTYMKSNNHVVQSRAKLFICPPLLLSQSVKELAFAISVHMTLGALATKAFPPITHRKVVWA